MRIETVAVHAGAEVDPATGAVTPPIHPSTTFEREPDGSFPHGHIYSRSSAPNRAALEACLTALEGGAGAVAFASASAATSAVFLSLAPGDHVVAPLDAYFGTGKLLREVYAGWGRRAVAVRLLAPAARHSHAAVPRARAVGARPQTRELPGRPPTRGARALPRAAVASGTRDREAPDGDVRRHALGPGQGRRGGRGRGGREDARLHAGDELRRHGESRRAPRVHRGRRDHHAGQPAARVDRSRAPRRPDRRLQPGARVSPSMSRLDGRTALVTGAGRGIGLAIS